VRDWLYVEDQCRAVWEIMKHGKPGDTYNIGGCCERANIETVRAICAVLDEMVPRQTAMPRSELITFVDDRPGHDLRYAIDCSKLERELGWRPKESFETGLRKTIRWYLDNPRWVERVRTGEYLSWIARHYGPSSGRE
jgi:dTDP-glucose 4,6-dehydratase